MKKKLMIYPFNSEFMPLLRHKTILKDYQISCLVAPNGWGTNNLDASCLDGGSNIGMFITNDFEKSLDNIDTILFNAIPNNPLSDNKKFYHKVLRNLEYAINEKKNIICTIELENEIYNSYLTLSKDKDITFEYYIKNPALNNAIIYDESLEKILVPLILISGFGERTHKFEIQLALREHFINLGYNVAQIGTKNYCEMIGFHSFPDFMFKNTISESNKIILFNKYVKEIEKTENPDIIIIGIPGGIIPYNDSITNRFGVTAFLVSNSIIPDVSILSLPFEEYNKELLEKISISTRYKLGFEIDCFNISNIAFDWRGFNIHNRIGYITFDSKLVDNAIEKINKAFFCKPVFNILNSPSSLNLSNYIYNKLTEHSIVEAF